jgi:hypothetical protein
MFDVFDFHKSFHPQHRLGERDVALDFFVDGIGREFFPELEVV